MTFPSAPVDVCAPTEWLPCGPYVTFDDLCGSCAGLDPNNPADVAVFDNAAWLATRNVWVATGEKYSGCCSTTFHPCSDRCGGSDNPYPYGRPVGTGPWLDTMLPAPVPVPGGWLNVWPCSCSKPSCLCQDYTKLRVPYVPIRGVTAITIGGVVLDPAVYFVSPDKTQIWRSDGEQWPECNSLTDPTVEWTVEYTFGVDLPPEAKQLVALYACELVKLCRRTPCDLPVGLYEVRGDMVVMVDHDPIRAGLYTGFPLLDDWIARDRGGRTMIRPRVTSAMVKLPRVGY